MKKLTLLLSLLLSATPCFADTLYFNNGKSLEGEILEANSSHALIERASDLQLFRIAIDSLTKDNQAYIKNNFTPMHESLPKFKKPLSDTDLQKHSNYIDSLVETKLRSYNLRPNKKNRRRNLFKKSLLKNYRTNT